MDGRGRRCHTHAGSCGVQSDHTRAYRDVGALDDNFGETVAALEGLVADGVEGARQRDRHEVLLVLERPVGSAIQTDRPTVSSMDANDLSERPAAPAGACHGCQRSRTETKQQPRLL